MKSSRFGLAALTLLLLMPAAPAASATGSIATCQSTGHIRFFPGLGATAQKATFTTNGETATLTCIGTVRGHEVAGPGTFGEEGTIEGTVLAGTGSSTVSVTIPTIAGPEKLRFGVTMTYAPGVGFKHGDALVGPLTFAFYPTVGNGVTDQVTEIAAVAGFALKSDAGLSYAASAARHTGAYK